MFFCICFQGLLFISRQNLSLRTVLLFWCMETELHFFNSLNNKIALAIEMISFFFPRLGVFRPSLTPGQEVNPGCIKSSQADKPCSHFSLWPISMSECTPQVSPSLNNQLTIVPLSCLRRNTMKHPCSKSGQGQSFLRAPWHTFFVTLFIFILCFLLYFLHDKGYFVHSSYAHRHAFFINFHSTLHIWRIPFA